LDAIEFLLVIIQILSPNRKIVKNPGPEDQVLISPQGGGVCRQITYGIMEWWKNGILGTKSG
jgi:hypothetical protein